MDFLSWRRSQIVSESDELGGRLGRTLRLSLDTGGGPGTAIDHDVPFVFPAASDVATLKAGTIRHLAPAPNVPDAETTKCVHVDFNESDLPWRYTPKRSTADGVGLPPWMVLLVGTTDELGAAGGFVTKVANSVLDAHPLDQSHLWAHVQRDGGVLIARLLSPRALAPLQNHVAVIVSAFTSTGARMWTPGTPPSEPLAAFFSWQFRAGEEGDFETLAAALRLRSAAGLGIAKLNYRRDTTDVTARLTVRGAITSIADLPDEHEDVQRASADLDLLNGPVRETVTPPIEPRWLLQMPDYGSLWHADTTAVQWTRSMNDDPRHRGIAGLGLSMGIVEQDALMDAAVQQAGALQDARQRVGNLAAGLDAAKRLWRKRLPQDPALQLRVFGPAMGRMLAVNGGTVLGAVTSGFSTLDPAIFSSAAQRLLRNGTARSRGTGGRIDRVAFFNAARDTRSLPERAPPGLPHADAVSDSLGEPPLEKALGARDIDARALEDIIRKFDQRPIDQDSVSEFYDVVRDAFDLDCRRSDYFNQFLVPPGFVFEREMILTAIARCLSASLPTSEVPIDNEVPLPPRPESQWPVNPDGLAGAVGGAIDPTVPKPPALVRVGSTIDGIDISGLAPPEAPIGLDYPTWTLLNRHNPEWLLPGGKSIPANSIVPLQTNPAFVDAFMVGINTQFLSEMRWRHLPAPRVSTPLRMFWGYVNHDTDTRDPDIEPVADWPSRPFGAAGADDVGNLSHQHAAPWDATGRQDLVIAFRTSLFRRYPNTLVYLVHPQAGDDLDTLLQQPPHFDAAAGGADGQRYLLPVFRGKIEPDLVFFAFDVPPRDLASYWLVLDEPPMELRFRSDKPVNKPSSADFADATIDTPTRVAIDGASLALEV